MNLAYLVDSSIFMFSVTNHLVRLMSLHTLIVLYP